MSDVAAKQAQAHAQARSGQGEPPGQLPPQDPLGIDEQPLEAAGMPLWLEVAFPWMVSLMLHAGVGLLLLFAAYMTQKALTDDKDKEPIIIPTAMLNDSGQPNGVPNPGTGGDPTRDAAQDRIKNVTQTDGWAQTAGDAKALASALEGNSSDSVADAILGGSGGTVGGSGKGGTGSGGGGPLAPFGTPGGGTQAGPKSNFFNTGGGAYKIVYILDHSGSLIDTFDYLRSEVLKSVDNLLAVQQFSVIVFSEKSEVLGPKQLQRATPEAKKELASRIMKVIPQNPNDNMLEPYADAFRDAFAMKPQLIYFLTDGKFDPRLMDKIRELNKDKKVHINAIAFVTKDVEYVKQLKDLARENGGMFKFVSEADLGR